MKPGTSRKVEVMIFPRGLLSNPKANNGPVIYALYNIVEKKYYIGMSEGVPMNRWWTHFYTMGSGVSKLTNAIERSYFSDWIFHIIENVYIPDSFVRESEVNEYVRLVESMYIHRYDSITNGYNACYSSRKFMTQISK